MVSRRDRNSYFTLFTAVFIFLIITSCQKTKAPDLQARYVITSPELAEIVCAIGGMENIVGVTTECDYPEELQTITKVGTFGSIDMEKVLTLEPTLVFVAGLEQDEIAFQLQKVGIPIVSIYPGSTDDLLQSVKEIGVILNKEENADELYKQLEQEIADCKNSRSENRSRIYVEIYGNPLMSVSDSSYVGELVELAGGDNIFASLPRAYSRIKPASVIELDPEIILLTYPGVTAEDVKHRMGWEVISACRNNRIYDVNDVDPDLILRAGSRLGEALKALKGIL